MSDFEPNEPSTYAPPSHTPPPPLPRRPEPEPEISGKAIASLLFGFFGLFAWVMGAIPALIFSFAALADVDAKPERYRGRGVAIVGLLLGLAGLVVMPIFLIAFLASEFGGDDSYVAGERLVHIHLTGAVEEYPTDSMFFFETEYETLSSLVHRINDAREDEEVKGLILTLESPALGMAQAEEIHTALMAFREVDKPVYVHATDLTTGSYALVSAASHINMVPTDTLWLIGLQMQMLYLADVMEEIGVKADMLQAGEFKSANEMFSRDAPSEAASANYEWLVDSYYETLTGWIGAGREMSTDDVKALIDDGPFDATQVVEKNLADSVSFLDEFLAEIKKEHGDDIYVDNYYYGPESSSGWEGFASHSDKPEIALIYASGTILRGYSNAYGYGNTGSVYSGDMSRLLDWLAEDEYYDALVIRIDSPGGSAVASEEILRAVSRVQEKMPVVVSMGDTAASGGYYIACKSDAIYADALTMTASIGVISGKFVADGLWEELGINWHSWKRGKNADIFDLNNPFSPAQREWLNTYMAETYDTFTGHVVDGRGDKLSKPIEELASGRVFTGAQALELGLVDALGGLDDAIEHAAELADIEDYDVTILPEPMTFWESFSEAMSGSGGRWSDLYFAQSRDDRALPRLALRWRVDRQENQPLLVTLAQRVAPDQARTAMEMIGSVELLAQEPVLTLMPQRFVMK